MVVAGRSALYRPPTQVADDGIWIRHEGRLQASVTRLETQGRAVSKGSSSLDLQSGEVQIATGESDPAEDVFPPYCRVSQHRVDRAPAILASPVLYDMGDGGQLSGPVGLLQHDLPDHDLEVLLRPTQMEVFVGTADLMTGIDDLADLTERAHEVRVGVYLDARQDDLCMLVDAALMAA